MGLEKSADNHTDRQTHTHMEKEEGGSDESCDLGATGIFGMRDDDDGSILSFWRKRRLENCSCLALLKKSVVKR